MRRFAFALVVALIAAAAAPAAAQKGKAPKAGAEPCVCPDAPPLALRESELAMCADGLDNDGDGHVDCADQDCGIYAVCVAPAAAPGAAAESPAVAPAPTPAPAPVLAPAPPPPPPGKQYSTMRELKEDLRRRAISKRDFFYWQMAIRLWRAAEFDAAKADYRAGRITKAELRARIAAVRAKWEG